MHTRDFERAIEALGVSGLEIKKFSYGINKGVVAVYAQLGALTFLKWDNGGRAFRFDICENEEGQYNVSHPEYLDYRRDADFDLKFE